MNEAPARYFDGITPAPREVALALSGPMLSIADASTGTEIVRWPLSDLHVPSQDDSIGEAMVHCRAYPDARLVIADPRAIALLAAHLPRLLPVVAPRPSGLKIWSILTVVAVAVLAGAAFAAWRGPEMLAPLVPQSWQTRLGDAIVENFEDRYGLCSSEPGAEALDDLADRLVLASGYQGPVQVEVIDSGIVNAFALPGGRIVLFRGLIDDAESPDEVAGVLAHELGHVAHLHPMRGLLRQLGLSFLRRLALGGYGDAVDTAAGVGEMMLALRNGRAAEREADAAALVYLEAAGLRQDGLHAFFARLAARHGADSDLAILSTHPPLEERRKAVQREEVGKHALDAGQWRALRDICDD